MKAAFVLIPDLQTQNVVTALAWQYHQQYSAGIDVRRVPPHLLLKQPFEAPDLPELVEYMDLFAKSIRPFHVEFEKLQVWPWPSADAPTSGVLALKVRETRQLRELHQRLNAELAGHFGERPAAFDGDGYSFHITVAAGGASIETYQEMANREHDFTSVDCRLEALALFVYDQSSLNDVWMYTTYRVNLI